MTLGQKIAELRKLNHYSQEELATQMKVSRQTISKWETDMSLPDIERIMELSQFFQVSLNELLQVDDEKTIHHDELQALFNQMVVIQENYDKEIQARKQQQRRMIVFAMISMICLCLLIGLLFVKLNQTTEQISILSSEISGSMNNLEMNIQDSLQNKDSLLSDFSYQIKEINLKDGKVKLLLKTALKDSSKNTIVQFMINAQNQESLKAIYKDGIYQYEGYIPLCDIHKLGVLIENKNQKRVQMIQDFELLIQSSVYNYHILKVNYQTMTRDNNYDRGHKITGIALNQDIEYQKENLQNAVNDFRNQEQIDKNENIPIIYDDFYIQKIEYRIYYEEEEIKKGTILNKKKNFDFQPVIDILIDPVSNGDVISVKGYVYDNQGRKYLFYNKSHAQYVLQPSGIFTDESIEELNENSYIE